MIPEAPAPGDRRALALLVPAVAFQALRKTGAIYDSDSWWHLATGRLILERRTVPRSDPFSWTAAGEPWQPNGWLSDAFLAVLERLGGLPLVAWLRPTFMVLIALGVYVLGRRLGAGPSASVAGAALAVFFAEPFVVERPQLFTFALLPLALVAARAALRGSNRALIGLLALVAVWANLHGAFVVGVGVVGLVCLGRAVDARTVKRPLIVVGSTVLAGLLTPFFLDGYLHALVVPAVSTEINEWRALDLTDPADWSFLVVPLLALALMPFTRRWRRLEALLPLVALTIGSILAIRNAPLAAIVGGSEVAVGLSGLGLPALREWARPRAPAIRLGIWVAGAVLVVQSTSGLAQMGDPEPAFFPVDTAPLIPAGCRLLNEYADGGYLIATRWPEVSVSQDGRNDLYGAARIAQQQRLLESGTPEEVVGAGIGCVLAEPDRPLSHLLRASPGWALIAEDRASALFVTS